MAPYFATQFNHTMYVCMVEDFQMQYLGLLASVYDPFGAILGRSWGPKRPKVGPRGAPKCALRLWNFFTCLYDRTATLTRIFDL